MTLQTIDPFTLTIERRKFDLNFQGQLTLRAHLFAYHPGDEYAAPTYFVATDPSTPSRLAETLRKDALHSEVPLTIHRENHATCALYRKATLIIAALDECYPLTSELLADCSIRQIGHQFQQGNLEQLTAIGATITHAHAAKPA